MIATALTINGVPESEREKDNETVAYGIKLPTN